MLIAFTFGLFTLLTGLAIGWLTNRLLFRVGFAVVVLLMRNREHAAQIAYRWRRPVSLLWIAGGGLAAILNLLLMLNPALHTYCSLTHWLSGWLICFGLTWLLRIGARELRLLDARAGADTPWQPLQFGQAPPSVRLTRLAVGWGSTLVGLTILALALAMLYVIHYY